MNQNFEIDYGDDSVCILESVFVPKQFFGNHYLCPSRLSSIHDESGFTSLKLSGASIS